MVVSFELPQDIFAEIEQIKQERKLKTIDDTVRWLLDSYYLSRNLINAINSKQNEKLTTES